MLPLGSRALCFSAVSLRASQTPFRSQSEISNGSAVLRFRCGRATKIRVGRKWKELVNANIAFKLEKEGFEGRMGKMGNHPAACMPVQREPPAPSALHPTQLPGASNLKGWSGQRDGIWMRRWWQAEPRERHPGSPWHGRGTRQALDVVASTRASVGQEQLIIDRRKWGRSKGGIQVSQRVTWQGDGRQNHGRSLRGEHPSGELWMCFRGETAFVNKGVPNFCLVSFFWPSNRWLKDFSFLFLYQAVGIYQKQYFCKTSLGHNPTNNYKSA